jgi:ATP-dependent DNA ligase
MQPYRRPYHIEGDGPTVFAHACKMGLEGIVSKRKDSTYRSGRSPDWLKMKNPEASAVKREAESAKRRGLGQMTATSPNFVLLDSTRPAIKLFGARK